MTVTERYIELRYVDDEKALTVVNATENMPVGGIAKVGCYAPVKKYGVDLGGEALEALDPTDTKGVVKYVIVAPDTHRYDDCLVHNKFGKQEDVEAGDATRAYFLHDTMVVRVEKDLITGDVAEGSLLKPAADYKYEVTDVASEAVCYVCKLGKYQGTDTAIIHGL